MAYSKQTKLGALHISDDVIATIAGGAAVECYGVVGMATKKILKDGIAELLKTENYSRGVLLREFNGLYHIDMYVILAYSVKIDEIVKEIQKKVQYTLEKMLNIKLGSVNVYVQGVRVTK